MHAGVLIIHLYGRERHAALADVTNHLLLRIDPHTRDVVGFQIEGFVTAVLPEHPEPLTLADAAGMPPEDIAAARSRIKPDPMNEAALSSLLDEFSGDLNPSVA